MHIFPPIGKNYAYFSPFDFYFTLHLILTFTKLQKKIRLNLFRLRRAPPHYNKFDLGTNIKEGAKF